ATTVRASWGGSRRWPSPWSERRKTPKDRKSPWRDPVFVVSLEFSGPGEIPAPDLEGRDCTGGAEAGNQTGFTADHLDVVHGLQVALGKAKVMDRRDDLAVLDKEGAVPGHTGHYHRHGVNGTRVPEPAHPDAALRGGEHVILGC